MVHLALMSSLLVCLRTQIFSFASVAAAWNWNIFICVFVCVHTYIFETGCKDKMLFQSKGKEKLQAKHRRGLWSLFSNLCLCIGFYSENFYHSALQVSVSQRLIRHRWRSSDALVRYSRGHEYDTGRVSLERALGEIPSRSFFGTQLQQRQSQGVFCPIRYVEKIRHLRRAGDWPDEKKALLATYRSTDGSEAGLGRRGLDGFQERRPKRELDWIWPL